MVIMLKAYSLTNKGHVVKGVTIKKWSEDTTFNFEMTDCEAWKKFLSNAQVNGKPLPRTSSEGFKVGYRVYYFGGYPPIRNLFPSTEPKGNKTKYLLTHGQLYPLKK